jgi:uncharacterized protein YrrD
MDRMAEEQIAWTAVKTGEAVLTNDGTNIGKVVEVAALASEDIFHGIVFEHAHHHKHYLAPAADVKLITTEAVHLSVDGAAADKYEEFEQLHVSRLGLSGIFHWKHVGWKDSNE